MKFFHTADWHLGKLVQGVYMTEDQRYILDRFLEDVEAEQPDVVIVAGDLYDRAVPPTEAVHLLNDVLEKIVLGLGIPVIAVAGNHDSPGRLDFGSGFMKKNGYYIQGQYTKDLMPIILNDEHGEVHFHLVPYTDPSIVRTCFDDQDIRSHDDAMARTILQIKENMDSDARHVFVGHAFVTPYGEKEANTSESERPLSIGGAEYVSAHHFLDFHYTALGHLHQAHHVLDKKIQYAGSILKYSASEANHKKGYYVGEMDKSGNVTLEKRLLKPIRDIRIIEGTMEELLKHPINDDYVFVQLLDEAPVLSPMEKIRSVYPNAMHIERRIHMNANNEKSGQPRMNRSKMSDFELFEAFYKEVTDDSPNENTVQLFKSALDDLLKNDRETTKTKGD